MLDDALVGSTVVLDEIVLDEDPQAAAKVPTTGGQQRFQTIGMRGSHQATVGPMPGLRLRN